jgi:RNA polymerase sigma factor (sigma-70 family)
LMPLVSPAISPRVILGDGRGWPAMAAMAFDYGDRSAASGNGCREAPKRIANEIGDASEMSAAQRKKLFAQVVLPHLDDAYALARWLTSNGADAEDVVQDACLRAFRAIGQYAQGDARVWVLTIVRHTAYRWLRKNRPSALVLGEDLETLEQRHAIPYEPDAETPETALIAKTESDRLKYMIESLPEPIREVLVLRDLQGRSYREIAEICALPMGTVMSRLARARQRLCETAAA